MKKKLRLKCVICRNNSIRPSKWKMEEVDGQTYWFHPLCHKTFKGTRTWV